MESRYALPLALVLAIGLVLGGCASAPSAATVAALLHDEDFRPTALPIDARQVFEPSDAMRRYADAQLVAAAAAPRHGRRRALIDAFNRQAGGLRLAYDNGATRTAAEAYAERAGNCLSLVILTASFAKYLDLPVRYQSVLVDEEYTRSGDLFFAAGHVNIALGRPAGRFEADEPTWLTIDFVPLPQHVRQRSVAIGEHTVLAMFMNNRAAEALAEGRIDDSYWWAREAVRQDPGFLAGINTLGVVYQRAGDAAAAESAWRQVLASDGDQVDALVNLTLLLRRQGRAEEVAPLAARLARLEPVPPLVDLERGREALARGDFAGARELLLRELRRQPHQHEAHFLLARAYAALGERAAAERHLELAAENGPTRGLQALYAAKLERLRGQHAQ